MEIEKTKQKRKENKFGKYFLTIIVSLLLMGVASAQSNSTIVTNSICPVVSSFGGFVTFQLIGVSVVLLIGGLGLGLTYKRQVQEASEKDTPMNYETMIGIGIGMLFMIIIIVGGIAYYQSQLNCPIKT